MREVAVLGGDRHEMLTEAQKDTEKCVLCNGEYYTWYEIVKMNWSEAYFFDNLQPAWEMFYSEEA